MEFAYTVIDANKRHAFMEFRYCWGGQRVKITDVVSASPAQDLILSTFAEMDRSPEAPERKIEVTVWNSNLYVRTEDIPAHILPHGPAFIRSWTVRKIEEAKKLLPQGTIPEGAEVISFPG